MQIKTLENDCEVVVSAWVPELHMLIRPPSDTLLY